jgi:hypothetical protein
MHMADKSLPDRDLQPLPATSARLSAERRELLRRAALVGLPVFLATVQGRTAWATGLTASCLYSNSHASACFQRWKKNKGW